MKYLLLSRKDYSVHWKTFVCVSCSVLSDSLWPHGLQPTRFPCPWDCQARILEWVAIQLARGCSWPRDSTQASGIIGRLFTVWATGKSLIYVKCTINRAKVTNISKNIPEKTTQFHFSYKEYYNKSTQKIGWDMLLSIQENHFYFQQTAVWYLEYI